MTKYYPTIKGPLFERFPGFKFECIEFGKGEFIVRICYSTANNEMYVIVRKIINRSIDWHQNDVISNEVRMVCERYLKNMAFS